MFIKATVFKIFPIMSISTDYTETVLPVSQQTPCTESNQIQIIETICTMNISVSLACTILLVIIHKDSATSSSRRYDGKQKEKLKITPSCDKS